MYIIIEVKKAIFIGGCLVIGGAGYVKVKQYRQQLETNAKIHLVRCEFNKLREVVNDLTKLRPKADVYDILRRKA